MAPTHSTPTVQDEAAFRFFGGRNLVAILVCASASGPAALGAVFVWVAISDPYFPRPGPFDSRDLVGFAIVLGLSSVYGLVGGLPAAIINSALHAVLIRHRMEGPFVSTIAGSILGALFGYLTISGIGYDARYETRLEVMFPLGFAGALIGLLYWLLVVRHFRRSA